MPKHHLRRALTAALALAPLSSGCARAASTGDVLDHLPASTDCVGDLFLAAPGNDDTGTNLRMFLGLLATVTLNDARTYGQMIDCGLSVENIERLVIARADASWGMLVEQRAIGVRRWMSCALRRSPALSPFVGAAPGVTFERWSFVALDRDRLAVGPTEWVYSVVSGPAAPASDAVRVMRTFERQAPYRAVLRLPAGDALEGTLSLSLALAEGPGGESVLTAVFDLRTPEQTARLMASYEGLAGALAQAAAEGAMPREVLELLRPTVTVAPRRARFELRLSEEQLERLAQFGVGDLRSRLRQHVRDERRKQHGIYH